MLDLKILNANVIDGSGKPAFRADVGIQDGKIAALGALAQTPALKTCHADGKTLTPGFIDIHRHADCALFRPDFGKLELAQGLTTIVNGNCGLSAVPCAGPFRTQIEDYLTAVTGRPDASFDASAMAGYLACAQRQGTPVHVGMLCGSGTTRAFVAGFDTVHLSKEQLRQIQAALTQALADGALGVSLGLGYAPDCFYRTEELIEALAPLRGSERPITVHMRQEGSGVVGALQEMIQVARALGTRVEISHLKSIGKVNWRSCTPQMLRLLSQARQEGLDIGCDVYPYTAGSTQLIHVLPPECQEGGVEELTRKLHEPAFRQTLKARMLTGEDFENISLLAGFENIVASSIPAGENKRFEGMSIEAIAAARGTDCFTALFDLLEQEHCAVTMIDFVADEEDIADILRDAHSCVISDATYPTSGMLHPRVYGSFARLIERYVLDQKVLSLEQAVHKVTGRAAQVMNLRTKGLIAPGMDADLLLFDPASIHERGTYLDPAQLAAGFDDILVAGRFAVENGRFADLSAGQILKA